jgi:hypothetical protein
MRSEKSPLSASLKRGDEEHDVDDSDDQAISNSNGSNKDLNLVDDLENDADDADDDAGSLQRQPAAAGVVDVPLDSLLSLGISGTVVEDNSTTASLSFRDLLEVSTRARGKSDLSNSSPLMVSNAQVETADKRVSWRRTTSADHRTSNIALGRGTNVSKAVTRQSSSAHQSSAETQSTLTSLSTIDSAATGSAVVSTTTTGAPTAGVHRVVVSVKTRTTTISTSRSDVTSATIAPPTSVVTTSASTTVSPPSALESKSQSTPTSPVTAKKVPPKLPEKTMSIATSLTTTTTTTTTITATVGATTSSAPTSPRAPTSPPTLTRAPRVAASTASPPGVLGASSTASTTTTTATSNATAATTQSAPISPSKHTRLG